MTADQEIEIKLHVSSLSGVENRLQELGARLVQPRTHEINLRFDTPNETLGCTSQVLRLRQDTAARLTYKGPGTMQDGVRTRQEIEFVVEDFNAARNLLEALGYQVKMLYEKYRTVYDLEAAHITLDEMPYGNFVEIEAPDVDRVQAMGRRLALDLQAAASESYVMIFDRLCLRLALPFRDLSFENFDGLEIDLGEMGIRPADRHL